jgi:hypothetical protein
MGDDLHTASSVEGSTNYQIIIFVQLDAHHQRQIQKSELH